MRKELISYLTGLSDKKYQMDCWINNQCPSGVEYDNFDFAVHFLFDDTKCAESPEELVGFFLHDVEEAKAVKSVCDSINQILDKYGCNKTDDEYIKTIEWDTILMNSKSALELLLSNDNS